MAKSTLIVLGVIVILMGIWALIPAWQISGVVDPAWHAIAKVVIGIIAVWIGAADKA